MDKYLPIKELSPSAYDFAIKALESTPEKGRYHLEDGAFASVCNTLTKDKEGANYEVHRRFIDVQMILEGEEVIGVRPLDELEKCKVITEFNVEKDYALYEAAHTDLRVLHRGDYLILGPKDGHSPGLCMEQPSVGKKIIFKIPVKG